MLRTTTYCLPKFEWVINLPISCIVDDLYEISLKCRFSYYNVIGPRVIRPNSEYHAAISVHGTSGPTTITATLEGQSFTGTPFLMQFKDTVVPYSTVISRFEVS